MNQRGMGGWAAGAVAVGRAVARELSETRRRRSARATQHTLFDQLAFLADASLVLGGSLEPQRIIDMIAALAVPRLGEAAIVWLREDGEGNGAGVRLAGSMFVDPRMDEFLRAVVAMRPPSVRDEIPPGVVIRTGQSYYIPYFSEDLARQLFLGGTYEWFRRIQAGPNITVPMFSRGHVLGALTVGRSRDVEFSSTEVSMIEELARRGATALDNAQLFRDAQEAALTLQRSLLPGHPPALEGMEIATEYRPGTAGTEVGGDLYDVIPLPGGCAGVAIGDVMGRGLHAAAVMGQLRAALRAYALEGWGPAEVLARLDRVVESLPGLQLATCMYAVYDPHARRATIANAGHLAPLLLLPDEEPDYLVLDPGLPLGMGDNGEFQETTVALPPGAAFVMFTDGLVESRRRSLADGLEHLRIGMREQMAWGGRPPAAAWADTPGLLRERRSGRDRRGGGGSASGWRADAAGWDRRRSRPAYAGRSRPGPQAARGGAGLGEESARRLLERCLLAADLPPRTDDDTALVVLLTTPLRPPLLEVALPPVPESAGRARSAVEHALADVGIDHLDEVLLLVSEVVTNAVLHARSDFVLRATLEPGRLRMSVEDREGGSLPRPGAGTPDAEHGWGLLLVETLSDAWGVETTADGKRVWFEMRMPLDDASGVPPLPAEAGTRAEGVPSGASSEAVPSAEGVPSAEVASPAEDRATG